MSLHIIRENKNPDVAPLRSGIHWINEATLRHWISVGNQTVNDWVEGDKAKTYKHDQLTPLATWVINHNFGEYPLIQVFDNGGNELEVECVHISLNQTEVRFVTPISGFAKLNI